MPLLPRSAPPARGFTLVEVMIVVAIIAILAAIALPSYSRYLLRAHRADVQAFMQQVASKQQLYLVDRRAYAASYTAAAADGGLGLAMPAALAGRYALVLATDNTTTPPSFTLTATPAGSQTQDSCGTLTLNHLGSRTASGSGSCW